MAARKLVPTKFVRAVFGDFLRESGLEPTITNAVPGKVDFELDIKKQHTNRLKILHGGTIASMVDLGGSLAVASQGLFATGVSTDLNVTYLSNGGAVGQTIKASAICDRIGKTLAYTTVTFTNEKGELAARGSHTKFVAKAWGGEPYTTDKPLFEGDTEDN
ncbi:acyl-coenzyme a thioesterase 13 [Ophiostoma piceae UAMH 11346]|uniref:Acyl-coenzyme a thioesterase 13 n=1 Tax=Ophiostoma piceae (strain UAMH 11346) TaxID=1262450 RepID=S3C365_OPHP1|nr:acyl-coenzyme a thioesterase 13 [Ophiostoma piceae UAMH 11346]